MMINEKIVLKRVRSDDRPITGHPYRVFRLVNRLDPPVGTTLCQRKAEELLREARTKSPTRGTLTIEVI